MDGVYLRRCFNRDTFIKTLRHIARMRPEGPRPCRGSMTLSSSFKPKTIKTIGGERSRVLAGGIRDPFAGRRCDVPPNFRLTTHVFAGSLQHLNAQCCRFHGSRGCELSLDGRYGFLTVGVPGWGARSCEMRWCGWVSRGLVGVLLALVSLLAPRAGAEAAYRLTFQTDTSVEVQAVRPRQWRCDPLSAARRSRRRAEEQCLHHRGGGAPPPPFGAPHRPRSVPTRRA